MMPSRCHSRRFSSAGGTGARTTHSRKKGAANRGGIAASSPSRSAR